MKVVAFTGNLNRPSRTRAVAEYAVSQASASGHQASAWDLVDLHPHLGATIWPSDAVDSVRAALADVATCDILIVGSPVYKASYTGLMKHFFDLLEMNALQGCYVLPFATGKAPTHGPLVEASMRALFSFFGARVSERFIFARDEVFSGVSMPTDLCDLVDRELDAARHIVSAQRAGV